MPITFNAEDWDTAASESGVAHDGVGDNSEDLQLGYPRTSSGASGTTWEAVNNFSDVAGYWPLDDSSGDATDYSGNLNHGTVTGATYGGGSFLSRDAMSFDGVDDGVSVSPHPSLSSFTFSLWANHDSLSTGQIAFHLSGNNAVRLQERNGDGTMRYRIYSGSADYDVLSTYTTGTWIHWVGVLSGGTMELYKNGISQGLTSGVTNGSDGGSADGIGHSPVYGTQWAGDIAEVRVYNRALTSAEITALYEAASQGSLETQSEVQS